FGRAVQSIWIKLQKTASVAAQGLWIHRLALIPNLEAEFRTLVRSNDFYEMTRVSRVRMDDRIICSFHDTYFNLPAFHAGRSQLHTERAHQSPGQRHGVQPAVDFHAHLRETHVLRA